MDDGFDESFRMTLLNSFNGVDVRGDQSHASSGLDEIDNGQSDYQRCGRNNLEINQGFDAHAPNFPKRTCPSDSCDNG